MKQSSVSAVLQELRGDIDASIAEHRRLLESASSEFRRRQCPVTLKRSSVHDWQNVHSGDHEEKKDQQYQWRACARESGSSRAQWDAFDKLLASIDAPKPEMHSRATHQPKQNHRQQIRHHERSLLRTQLAILASECKHEARTKREARPLSPDERREWVRQCYQAWRIRAKEKKDARAVNEEARSRCQDNLVCRSFRLWQSWYAKQTELKGLYRKIANSACNAALCVAFNRWAREHHRRLAARKLRSTYQRSQTRFLMSMWKANARCQYQMRLWQQERHHTSCMKTMRAWRSAAISRSRKREQLMLARDFYKRRTQLKVLVRLKRGGQVRAIIASLTLRHFRNLQSRCFLEWCAYLEAKKRYRFAVTWYHQNLCARAFDLWNTAYLRRKRNARVLQSFMRRRMRNLARQTFTALASAVQAVRNRRAAILKYMQRRELRACFAHLHAISKCFAGREAAFAQKRAHRAVWEWFRNTQGAISTKRKCAVVEKREAARVLREVGWRKWRSVYLMKMKQGMYQVRWRRRFTQRVWRAFVKAIDHKKHIGALHQRAVVHFERQLTVRFYQLWGKHCVRIRERRDAATKANRHFEVTALNRVFSALKAYQLDAFSSQAAESFFLCRAIKTWKCSAEFSKRQRVARMERLSTLWRRILLHWHFGRFKCFRQLKRQERCRWILREWKKLPRLNQARSLLSHLGNMLQLWRTWCRWMDRLRYARQLRASAGMVRKRWEQTMRRRYFVEQWRDKVIRYRLACCRLESVDRNASMQSSFEMWRQLKKSKDRERRAENAYMRILKRRIFGRFARMAAGMKSRMRVWRTRRLAVYWGMWRRFLKQRIVLHDAEYHHKQVRMQRVVSRLHSHAHEALKRDYQHKIADSWSATVLIQNTFSTWQTFLAKQERLRQCMRSAEWKTFGRRAWDRWRKSLIQEQYVRVLQNMQRRALMTQTWNAMVQVTKRRHVAKSIWKYAMINVRLSKCLYFWQQYVELRKLQQQRVDLLLKNKHKAHLQVFFAAWSQFLTVQAFTALRARRHVKRYSQTCWRSWTLHTRVQRLRCKANTKLMRRIFICGFQRNAFYRQASREVQFRNETRQLEHALKQWRVELWLRASQRRIELEQKECMLRRWLRFVDHHRQKRKLAAHVRQLHRLHETSGPVRFSRRQRVFEKTVALQEQANEERRRRTKREVFDAWQLAAKCMQRARAKQLGMACPLRAKEHGSLEDQENRPLNGQERAGSQDSRSQSTYVRGQRLRLQSATRSGDLIALEFWSTRLLSTCFYMWKHSHRLKKHL